MEIFYFLPYFISCTSSFEDKKKSPPSLLGLETSNIF